MKARPRFALPLAGTLMLGTATLARAGDVAQPAQVEVAAYSVDWSTNDGGGGRSLAGSYVLTGTVGQTDADPLQPSTGGTYQIDGGFWGGSALSDDVFRDGFE